MEIKSVRERLEVRDADADLTESRFSDAKRLSSTFVNAALRRKGP
jgi:hypothetical protein